MLIAVELDQVEAFVAIVRGGGFTRGAALLHLSQPAVSRRLELLEHELGAPLFERTPKGVIRRRPAGRFCRTARGPCRACGTAASRSGRSSSPTAARSRWRSSARWRARP